MRKNLGGLIVALFLVGSCGACAVGLNKKLDKLNSNLEASRVEMAAIRAEAVKKIDEFIVVIAGLRDEVAGLKSTAAGQADVQVRIAEALESINKKAEDFLRLKKILSP